MWQRIRTLILKELLAVWRDPKSRTILIVPPLIQMLVFTFAATQEVKHVRLAVLNRDLGTAPAIWWHGSRGLRRFRKFSTSRTRRTSNE